VTRNEDAKMILEEKYVIEKYNGDIHTEEFLAERIVMVNDKVVSHYIR